MPRTHILKNLNVVMKSAEFRYQNEFLWQEISLKNDFQDNYRRYLAEKGCEIEYLSKSSIITTKQNQYIFLPNQWFVIASYVVDFCTELFTYKEYAVDICSSLSTNVKDYIKNCRGSNSKKEHFERCAIRILERQFPGRDDYVKTAEYLWKFLSDYSWWDGGKTIDRNDFYVSPVLNKLNLVHESHGYVAEIVNAYASNYLLRRKASDINSIAADFKTKTTVLEANELIEEIVPKKITLKENVEFQYDASPINISIASLQRFQSRK